MRGQVILIPALNMPAVAASSRVTPLDGLFTRNLGLARAFGLPLIWQLGAHNDSRSVNSAAERARVAMIAAELGGGGGTSRCNTAAPGGNRRVDVVALCARRRVV